MVISSVKVYSLHFNVREILCVHTKGVLNQTCREKSDKFAKSKVSSWPKEDKQDAISTAVSAGQRAFPSCQGAVGVQ